MRVLTIALATAALGLATATATPASAAVLTLCGSGSSCLSGTTNVNLVDTAGLGVATGQGNVGIGGPGVTFTSTQGNIILNASGQATITSAVSSTLTQLTFTMAPGFSFTAAEFNLFSGTPKSFDVTLTTNTGATQLIHIDNSNGSNWFDIIANLPGESFTSASFSSSNGGFDAFRQLRLTLGNGTQPLPEPATWGMMLLGFAGVGMAMRRRRAGLMQIA